MRLHKSIILIVISLICIVTYLLPLLLTEGIFGGEKCYSDEFAHILILLALLIACICFLILFLFCFVTVGSCNDISINIAIASLAGIITPSPRSRIGLRLSIYATASPLLYKSIPSPACYHYSRSVLLMITAYAILIYPTSNLGFTVPTVDQWIFAGIFTGLALFIVALTDAFPPCPWSDNL